MYCVRYVWLRDQTPGEHTHTHRQALIHMVCSCLRQRKPDTCRGGVLWASMKGLAKTRKVAESICVSNDVCAPVFCGGGI